MTRASTYRVQLHAGFTFSDAAAIVDYLACLGITHLYCSPYLQAAEGSTHGYDVVDHSRLNDELGGGVAHQRLMEVLSAHHMGHILDIVPNHMARDGRANRWWWDMLENGPASRYAAYFDVDWAAPEDKSDQTVLIPILGDHYGRVLEDGALQVSREAGSLTVNYHEHQLPLSPRSLDSLLARAAEVTSSEELAELAGQFGALPHARLTDVGAITERHQHKELLRDRLARLCAEDAQLAAALDDQIDRLNHDPEQLDLLLSRQNFRLAFWRTASEELDYRRFFNIETLVGLRIEDEDVFADTHALILGLVRDGAVDGLRIDHVDGLRDPEGYLHRLRRATGGTYTVVEKILEPGEKLPEEWPVEGTSGYDFVTQVGNLFVDQANEAALTGCYQRFSGEPDSYEDVAHGAKIQVMRVELCAEIERLTRVLAEVCDGHRRQRDHTRRELREALREVIAAFSVYRTYVQANRPVSEADRASVRRAIAAATELRPDIDSELLDFVGGLLLLRYSGRVETEFAIRFAQVSAPVMAKGVEDTAFYRYHRLVSLNEVGGDPGAFGRSVEDFHSGCAATARSWPETMLTLSTHDTKRSADVRARIHLISEIPDAWEAAVGAWSKANEAHRSADWPDRNAEYLLYQTLVGAWPIEADRVAAFMEKATKEAKVHTSWVDPDAGYDEALASFVRGILADADFVEALESFLAEHSLVELGRATSLAQATLLLTCPGIPDVYQGTELWDNSLVDPDNRRPVDYAHLRRILGELDEGGGDDPTEALRLADEGGPKLWVISRLLRDRRAHPQRYASGQYEALPVTGAQASRAVAFSRGDLVVLVPRLVVGLAGDWAGTTVTLPEGAWRDLLSGAVHQGGPREVCELLASFPVAVLVGDTT